MEPTISIPHPEDEVTNEDLNKLVALSETSDDETITKTTAIVLLVVETPPSKIPAASIIKPIIVRSPVRACMPSMNVWAIPEYDVTNPANPIAVRPAPGIIKSQLLNLALMVSQ